MAKKTATATRQWSILDLLHKGIWPALAISVALFVWRTNADKQRQIDQLQAEARAVKEQQQEREQKLLEQVQKAEEEAQAIRVEVYRNVLTVATNIGNNPEDLKVGANIRAAHAILCAGLMMNDKQRLGEEKANEVWEKARKQAEKEVKAGKLDNFI